MCFLQIALSYLWSSLSDHSSEWGQPPPPSWINIQDKMWISKNTQWDIITIYMMRTRSKISYANINPPIIWFIFYFYIEAFILVAHWEMSPTLVYIPGIISKANTFYFMNSARLLCPCWCHLHLPVVWNKKKTNPPFIKTKYPVKQFDINQKDSTTSFLPTPVVSLSLSQHAHTHSSSDNVTQKN